MNKYKISINDIERKGGIAKLEKDGFSREQIIKKMYHLTDGASQSQRTDMVNKLYNRAEPC